MRITGPLPVFRSSNAEGLLTQLSRQVPRRSDLYDRSGCAFHDSAWKRDRGSL